MMNYRPDDSEAAALAAAILRFQEPLAHLPSTSTPAGMPVVGVDAYVFLPSVRRVPRAGIEDYLAALPGPALLAATTARGVVALVLLDELAGERRASLEHEIENQRDGLLAAAPGADADRVLLEFDAETHLFSLAGVRRWSERYLLTAGWNIQPCPEPARAEWRLNLFGGDGRRYSRGAGKS